MVNTLLLIILFLSQPSKETKLQRIMSLNFSEHKINYSYLSFLGHVFIPLTGNRRSHTFPGYKEQIILLHYCYIIILLEPLFSGHVWEMASERLIEVRLYI